jgi:hypothetical protein
LKPQGKLKEMHKLFKRKTRSLLHLDYFSVGPLVGGLANIIDQRPTTGALKGQIHYSNIIRVMSEAHINYAQSQVTSIDKSQWSRIKNNQTHKPNKQPPHSRKISEEKRQIIIEFWNSEEISRISSGKTCVTKRKCVHLNRKSESVPGKC